MSASKPYSENKDSSITWIGNIPTHWELTSVRDCVTEIRDRNDLGQDAEYLSLMANIGVILYADKGDVGNKKPEDLGKCKKVAVGDLVINSMNYGIGSYGISPYDGVCSPVYIVLRPQEGRVESAFIKRIFEVREFQRLAQSFGNGILEHRRSIGWDTLKNLRVALPSMKEQRAIASFLDRETAEIDAFIADQNELVALLNERRAAAITHAVTEGMSDSRAASWRGTRLRYEVALNPGPSPFVKDQPDSELSFLPMEAVGDRGELDLSRTRPVSEVSVGYSYFENDDVSFAKVTPCFENGKGAVFRDLKGDAGFGTTELTVARVRSGLHPSFLYFVFQSDSFRQGGVASMTGAGGLKRVPDSYVRDYQLALPSIEEQKAIVGWLSDELDKIDAAIADAKQAIELSKERRAALISAAVTGKIDVRNHILSDLGAA